RIVNIHPALLPRFGGQGMYGRKVHQAVLDAGEKVSGATVHFVNEHYDEGDIIAQKTVPVLPGDTAESLAARVLEVEHLLLPDVLEQLARSILAEEPNA
ncbi:MAG TPA: formyltransferase family protein, partial [Longimicrobiales bacterium]